MKFFLVLSAFLIVVNSFNYQTMVFPTSVESFVSWTNEQNALLLDYQYTSRVLTGGNPGTPLTLRFNVRLADFYNDTAAVITSIRYVFLAYGTNNTALQTLNITYKGVTSGNLKSQNAALLLDTEYRAIDAQNTNLPFAAPTVSDITSNFILAAINYENINGFANKFINVDVGYLLINFTSNIGPSLTSTSTSTTTPTTTKFTGSTTTSTTTQYTGSTTTSTPGTGTVKTTTGLCALGSLNCDCKGDFCDGQLFCILKNDKKICSTTASANIIRGGISIFILLFYFLFCKKILFKLKK